MNRIRIGLESYAEAMDIATAVNALHGNNEDLMRAVAEDINELIRYSTYMSDEVGISRAVEFLMEGLDINGEEATNDRINDVNYVAGMLAVDILAACFLVEDFYNCQLATNTIKLYEVSARKASMHIVLEHLYELDDGRSPDASRIVGGFFTLYRCAGTNAQELKNEIRCSVSGYIGTAARGN